MPDAKGVFIGIRIEPESAKLVRAYTESLNLPCKLMSINEYHISIAYSKKPARLDYPLDKEGPLGLQARAFDVRYIGNAVAILFVSEYLRWRALIAQACGIKSDFPGYIPHMSLCYDPPKGLPIAWYPKPKFPVILREEYIEPVKSG
jgi:hypothetical protein